MFDCVAKVTDDDEEEEESDYAPDKESDEELEYDDDEFDDFIDKGGDEVEDDMLSKFSSMTLKGAPVKSGGCFNVSEEPTWLIYDFVQNDKHYCCVDVLTLTMGRDKFRPRVSANGRKVMVEMVKPKFFFGYERMENYHSNDSSFNGNTHKANAFKAVLKETRKTMKVRRGQEITGKELTINLPFQCEVEIVEWGLQAHVNEDFEIQRVTKAEQLYYILSMTFLSTEKAEEVEKQGTFKIVRKTPKKATGRRAGSRGRKKRKNDSFETAQGGADPDLDYSMQDNDDDLSEVSESAFPSAL